MSRPDWYRNVDWNAEVASGFEAKLGKARRKEQYLRIQAGTLAASHPDVAHGLLDRFFSMPDQFDAAQAHVDRATAYLAQEKVDEALDAYERALAREADFPKLRTQAYVNFPFEIATRAVRSRYSRALEILEEHKSRLMFALDFFKWNAAQAPIALELGRVGEPYGYAKAALEAAEREHSGFGFHPEVGLVQGSLAEVQARLRRLCDA